MYPFFETRIKELKLRCPDEYMIYVTVPHEEVGACSIEELDASRHAIGRVGDSTEKLYEAWMNDKR